MIAVTISHPLGPIPMPDLLRRCVYYPSAHLDGDPVKYLGRYFQSVDYGVGEHLVLNDLPNFRGYDQISNRQVCQDVLVLQGWQPPVLRPEDGDPTREAGQRKSCGDARSPLVWRLGRWLGLSRFPVAGVSD